MSLRDKIRAATVGKKAEFKKIIMKYEGFDVEFRQPSVKSRKQLFKMCMNEVGQVDTADFLVWATIYNTYVPETDERVFEEADYETLVEKPAGGFLDTFGAEVSKLLNVEDDSAKK